MKVGGSQSHSLGSIRGPTTYDERRYSALYSDVRCPPSPDVCPGSGPRTGQKISRGLSARAWTPHLYRGVSIFSWTLFLLQLSPYVTPFCSGSLVHTSGTLFEDVDTQLAALKILFES